LPVTGPPHWRVRRARPEAVTWSAAQPTIPTAPGRAALHQGTASVHFLAMALVAISSFWQEHMLFDLDLAIRISSEITLQIA
jgi:hypothetical protein